MKIGVPIGVTFPFPASLMASFPTWRISTSRGSMSTSTAEAHGTLPRPRSRRAQRRGRQASLRSPTAQPRGRDSVIIHHPGHRNQLGDHQQHAPPQLTELSHLESTAPTRRTHPSGQKDPPRAWIGEQWPQRLSATTATSRACSTPDLFVVGGGHVLKTTSSCRSLDHKTPMVSEAPQHRRHRRCLACYAARHSA